nr:putative serine protease [Pine Lake virus]
MKFPSFAEVTALFVEQAPAPAVATPVPVQVPILEPVIRDDWAVRAVVQVASLLSKAVVRETVYQVHGQTHTAHSVRWGVVAGVAGTVAACWAGRKFHGYIRELKSAEVAKPKAPLIELKSDDMVASPECMREGSSFKQGSYVCVPAGQMAIGWESETKSNDGKTTVYFVVGAALRVNNWAVFPTHCIMANKKMFLMRPTQGAEPAVVSEMKMSEIYQVCPDVSAAYIDEAEFTRMGIKKIRLGKPTFGDAAQITTMVDYKYSTGVVKQAKERFGHIEYHGSTAPGFSGSGYQVGQSIIGMHMHGGSVNGGIEMPYLLVLLRFLEKLESKPSSYKAPTSGILTPEARQAATEGSDYIPDDAGRLEVSHIGAIDDVQYCAVRTTMGDYRLTTEERIKTLTELRKKQKVSKLTWAEEVEMDDLEKESVPSTSKAATALTSPTVPSRIVAGHDEVVALKKALQPQYYRAYPPPGYGQYLPPTQYLPPAVGQAAVPAYYALPGQQPPVRPHVVPEAVMTDNGLAYPGEFQRPGVLANPGSAICNAPPVSSSKSVAAQQKRTDRQKYINLVSNLSTDLLATVHRLSNTGELQRLATSQRTPVQQPSGIPSMPSSAPPQSSAQQ